MRLRILPRSAMHSFLWMAQSAVIGESAWNGNGPMDRRGNLCEAVVRSVLWKRPGRYPRGTSTNCHCFICEHLERHPFWGNNQRPNTRPRRGNRVVRWSECEPLMVGEC